MQITIGKILGLLIAGIYALVAFWYGGVNGVKWSAGLLLPLAAIWFPEEIGSLTGYFRTGYVNVQTPAFIIAFIGWLFLLGLPAIAYLLR